jgi:hypothetical protein
MVPIKTGMIATTTAAFLLTTGGPLWAQQPDDDRPTRSERETDRRNNDPGQFNRGKASVERDPHPSPPKSDGIRAGLHRQAGTGGEIAFAEAGVLEFGGAGSFDTNADGTLISLRPSVGWFLLDNLQLSGIVEMRWANPADGDAVTSVGVFAEPSYHIPVTDRVLAFGGGGVGMAYNSEDLGFALRPRIGVDVLVGRSGIFRPSLDLTWSTADVVTRQGETLVGVRSSYGVSFGYHVMF